MSKHVTTLNFNTQQEATPPYPGVSYDRVMTKYSVFADAQKLVCICQLCAPAKQQHLNLRCWFPYCKQHYWHIYFRFLTYTHSRPWFWHQIISNIISCPPPCSFWTQPLIPDHVHLVWTQFTHSEPYLLIFKCMYPVSTFPSSSTGHPKSHQVPHHDAKHSAISSLILSIQLIIFALSNASRLTLDL